MTSKIKPQPKVKDSSKQNQAKIKDNSKQNQSKIKDNSKQDKENTSVKNIEAKTSKPKTSATPNKERKKLGRLLFPQIQKSIRTIIVS